MSDIVSLRLDSTTRQRLDNLSLATERSRSAIAAEAVRVYLDTQDWQIAAIKQGVIQADAGNLIDHAQLKAKWEKRLADQMDSAR